MQKLRILHTADLHFSNNTDNLSEVIRTTDFVLQQAIVNPPDCIVIAGDSLDEYVSPILARSACYKAATSFVERAADIAPVVIIRGTKSHDRETPCIFSHLRSRFPIHVASNVQMIALMSDGHFYSPDPVGGESIRCVFTLVPELDKAYIEALDSIRSGNMAFREAVHDLFAGFGLLNNQFTDAGVPTVLVNHCMLTGAAFSSGQTAVGEGLEIGLNDLHSAKCSATMLGHVHKQQTFAGNVAYSGSPGRLNFGEREEKGFLVWEFDGAKVAGMDFVKTPAHRFCFGDIAEYRGPLDIWEQAEILADDCSGADVRFRFSIPEECRADVDRARLEQMFVQMGAGKVKIEISVIPKQRSRAEGISRAATLPDKVLRWGATVSEVMPTDVVSLSSVIEGISAEELLVQALVTVNQQDSVPVGAQSVIQSNLAGVGDNYFKAEAKQAGLF